MTTKEMIEEDEQRILETNRACRGACIQTIAELKKFLDSLGFERGSDMYPEEDDYDDMWRCVDYKLGFFTEPNGSIYVDMKSCHVDLTHLRLVVKLERYKKSASPRETTSWFCQYFQDENDLKSVNSFIREVKKAILEAYNDWRSK